MWTTVSVENTSRGATEFDLKDFCVLVNFYRLFKTFTLGSRSQYGTLQQIMNNASSLYDSAGRKRSKQYATSIKINELKSISTI